LDIDAEIVKDDERGRNMVRRKREEMLLE